MPRAIWSGNISFGLVTVPVKLYSAVKQKTVRFHQLHAKDHVRIEQKRICPADGEEVAYSDIVKGYELAPNRYVIVEPQELAALAAADTSSIEIEDFVELSEIDPIYYDHAYYIVPATGGEKAYQLLRDAMNESEKVAIAKVVLRSKEHLVAIRPIGDVLGMATMNFADEIMSVSELDELPAKELELSSREREIARKLIDSLSVNFDASKYKDSYREAILGLIERKANGEEIAEQPKTAPRTSAPDLMSALQESLEQVRKREPAPKRKANAKAAPGKAKATPTKPKRAVGESNGSAANTKSSARTRAKAPNSKT